MLYECGAFAFKVCILLIHSDSELCAVCVYVCMKLYFKLMLYERYVLYSFLLDRYMHFFFTTFYLYLLCFLLLLVLCLY